MLSKSSSLRSQQTTTKELIPSITASANTLATQHQHGTQEPHWQILAAFSMNSELRWSFPSKRGSDKYWNWIGFQEEKWSVCRVKHSLDEISHGQFALFFEFPTSNCSVGGSEKEVLFWKSPQRWLPHVQDAWGSWTRVIVWNQWSSSCIEHDGSGNMLAQTREARLPTSAVFSTSLTLALVFACRQTAPENSGFLLILYTDAV